MEPRAHNRVFPAAGRVFFDPRSHDEVSFLVDEIFGARAYLGHGVTLEPGATIVDAGANIGLFAIWAHRECGGRARIFSFEPVPSTFENLLRNLAEHGIGRDAVMPLNLGLTHSGGPSTARFTVYAGLPGNATMNALEKEEQLDAYLQGLLRSEEAQNPLAAVLIERRLAEARQKDEVECRLTTLAEACREHDIDAIDLLKVDVEGAELDVLDGVGDAVWPRIRQVVLETHTIERTAAIERLLEARGFGSIHIERPDWAEDLELDTFAVHATR